MQAERMRGQGRESSVILHGKLGAVHGETVGTFNGGPWKPEKMKVRPAKSCTDCAEGTQCVHVTATIAATYSVTVSIAMPDVPDGLTACEAAAMRIPPSISIGIRRL